MGSSLKHILVVDDDLAVREWFRIFLEVSGYAVYCVSNGREALEYLRGSDLPTLILLDLQMPLMNGWQFRREQRASSVFGTVPVILVSSQADLEEQAVTLAAVGSLRKPLEVLDGLLKLINEITHLQPAER